MLSGGFLYDARCLVITQIGLHEIYNKKFCQELIRLLSPHTSHLFEVLEPNLMEIILNEVTLT
jgi:hypothetical protein